jgi:hypothetical protein
MVRHAKLLVWFAYHFPGGFFEMPTTSPSKQTERLQAKNVTLSPGQIRAIERMAARQKRSFSYLLREAIDAFLSANS